MGVVVGFLFGMVLSFGVTMNVFESEVNTGYRSKELIKQCQKDLPRDQYCTIIAVPGNEIEE